MRNIIMTMVVITGLFVSSIAHAGMPTAIDLNYDADSKTLNVSVKHRSKDTSLQYVEAIAVTINGTQMLKQNFLSQGNKISQEAKYVLVDAKDGDTITISVTENIIKQTSSKSVKLKDGALIDLKTKSDK